MGRNFNRTDISPDYYLGRCALVSQRARVLLVQRDHSEDRSNMTESNLSKFEADTAEAIFSACSLMVKSSLSVA